MHQDDTRHHCDHQATMSAKQLCQPSIWYCHSISASRKISRQTVQSHLNCSTTSGQSLPDRLIMHQAQAAATSHVTVAAQLGPLTETNEHTCWWNSCSSGICRYATTPATVLRPEWQVGNGQNCLNSADDLHDKMNAGCCSRPAAD